MAEEDAAVLFGVGDGLCLNIPDGLADALAVAVGASVGLGLGLLVTSTVVGEGAGNVSP